MVHRGFEVMRPNYHSLFNVKLTLHGSRAEGSWW